ncbi:hypothetical protein H9Q73_002961 [Fusarium xylarioides]|nr:hypothetical protein H9Q73_002961 [Fusarium xylarioides]
MRTVRGPLTKTARGITIFERMKSLSIVPGLAVSHYSQKIIPCLQCDETFTRPDNLKRHVEEIHEGKRRKQKS